MTDAVRFVIRSNLPSGEQVESVHDDAARVDAQRLLWAATVSADVEGRFWRVASLASAFFADGYSDRRRDAAIIPRTVARIDSDNLLGSSAALPDHAYAMKPPADQLDDGDEGTIVLSPRTPTEGFGALCCCRLAKLEYSYAKSAANNPSPSGYYIAQLTIVVTVEWVTAPNFLPCTLEWEERTTADYSVEAEPENILVRGGNPPGTFGPWIDLSDVAASAMDWKRLVTNRTSGECPILAHPYSLAHTDTPGDKKERRQEVRVSLGSGCLGTSAKRKWQGKFTQSIDPLERNPDDRFTLDPDSGRPSNTTEIDFNDEEFN